MQEQQRRSRKAFVHVVHAVPSMSRNRLSNGEQFVIDPRGRSAVAMRVYTSPIVSAMPRNSTS